MYWVHQEDDWYASSRYSGPWARVAPAVVPLFIQRVPVSYYRNPPAYFRGWQPDAPPRWGQHWGKGWEQQRSGWNRWNRRSTPAAAPLPVDQQQAQQSRQPQPPQQQAVPHQQTTPKASRENASHGASQEPRHGHGQDKERVKGEERGQDRNR
jgi:hypothetical protein